MCFFWLEHWMSPSSEAVSNLHAWNAKEHLECSLAAGKADTEQSGGCSQIVLWHWGVCGCLSPHAGSTGVVSGRGEGLVQCLFPTYSWESVSALQKEYFLRAALMGTGCSPQPDSSGKRTFRSTGTYTRLSSGTVGRSDKNDDAEQAKWCKRASVDCMHGLYRLLWNKPSTWSSHCNNTQPLCFSAFL